MSDQTIKLKVEFYLCRKTVHSLCIPCFKEKYSG